VAALDVLRSCVCALADLLSAATGKAYTAEKLTHILSVLPLPQQALFTDACNAWRESRSAANAGALIIVQPDSRLEVAAGSHRLMHRHHWLVLPEGGLNVTTEDDGVGHIFVLRQDMVHAGAAYYVRHVRLHIYLRKAMGSSPIRTGLVELAVPEDPAEWGSGTGGGRRYVHPQQEEGCLSLERDADGGVRRLRSGPPRLI